MSQVHCSSCNHRTWDGFIIHGMCPACLIRQPVFTIQISFAYSRSKKYDALVKRIAKHPCYSGYLGVEGRHIITLHSYDDYIKYRRWFNNVLSTTSMWKSFQVFICGISYKPQHLEYLFGEINRYPPK